MHRFLTLILLFLLLSSHELFLKTDSYFLEERSHVQLYLFNGTFDKSENTITRDRIINAKITGPEYEVKPATGDYYDKDDVTFLKLRTGGEGTYVAGISTKSRIIELSGQDFTEYLDHEGLTQVISDRTAKGISDKPANEKYSKHVKAILQVGNQRTDHYSTEFGYPIEFIPLQNPYELSVGDKMNFKLVFNQKPLKNQTVHISSREEKGDGGRPEISTTTDDRGEFRFEISNNGQWYVAAIHMAESDDTNLDYESNWATLTFEVK